MQSHDEQLEFFNTNWPAMQQAVESGGSAGVIEFINGFEDDRERRVLYLFANQGLVNREWSGKSLDVYIEVADAGIIELLAQADAATDDATRDQRIDTANIISYNMSADLADCWPGDKTPRTLVHFLRGLRAAEDCIDWRRQLDKPPGPHAMAWWAKGMHEISLSHAVRAVESLTTSLAYAKDDARERGLPTALDATGTFSVILGSGYVGLARELAGDNLGQAQYDEALKAFREQLDDEAKCDDARFGIDQLETVMKKYSE